MASDIKTVECIVGIIDILGYKKMIQSKDDQEKFLQNIYNLFIKIKEDSDSFSGYGISHFFYSDNIVINIKLENDFKFRDADVYNLIGWAAFIQSYILFEYNYLSRGSIVIGDYYQDNEIGFVFGKSIVDAYELENKKAIYPRIIIDKTIVNLNYCTNAISKTCLCDEDGYYFADYLNFDFYTHIRQNMGIEWNISYLKERIKFVYNKNKSNNEVIAKYEWLVSYFNKKFPANKIEKV